MYYLPSSPAAGNDVRVTFPRQSPVGRFRFANWLGDKRQIWHRSEDSPITRSDVSQTRNLATPKTVDTVEISKKSRSHARFCAWRATTANGAHLAACAPLRGDKSALAHKSASVSGIQKSESRLFFSLVDRFSSPRLLPQNARVESSRLKRSVSIDDVRSHRSGQSIGGRKGDDIQLEASVSPRRKRLSSRQIRNRLKLPTSEFAEGRNSASDLRRRTIKVDLY